jgi:phospholipase C
VSPSEPNYLWLEAGTNFSVQNDDDPYLNHQNTTNHLVTLLNNAGISWKAYDEDISGTNVPLQSFGNYVARHNPFVYFDDVTGTNDPNNAYAIAHIRPFTELAGDLAANNIASYNFITPNVCDDMHDACAPLTNALLQGDNWLSNNLPLILTSRAFQDNGAIFITWDESETPGLNPLGMIVLSPWAKGGGYFNQVAYNHSSTLRTVQDIFGITNYLGDAVNATNLSDLFWPPGLRLTGFSMNSGGVQMSVIGAAPGKTNLIESSTNLVDWISIGTNYPITNYFSFSNATSTNLSQSFYRIVQLP